MSDYWDCLKKLFDQMETVKIEYIKDFQIASSMKEVYMLLYLKEDIYAPLLKLTIHQLIFDLL